MAKQREQAQYQSPLELGTVHADVVRECAAAVDKGWPYTELRPIRQGVDNSEGRKCEGCQGHFHEDCDKPIVAVNYTSSQGESFFYCEEHGIAQDEWEDILYRSKPKELPEMSQEWHDEVAAIMRKLTKKDRKKREEEDLDDPT